ncbi:hypothetical protein GCM10023115_01570 [Pontixanthobacter gangjinensis]
MNAEPRQIGADCVDIFFFAPFGIGIVDPQHEFSAQFLGEHPIVQRGANVADMKAASGRWGKAGYGFSHAGAISLCSRTEQAATRIGLPIAKMHS